MAELGDVIEENNFILVSVAIDKTKLSKRYRTPDNPYHIALKLCLERLYYFLREKLQEDKLTHIVVENRGKKEDAELELEFREICSGKNGMEKTLAFELVFADKKSNSPGLQLADLVARPIGLHVLKPGQENRAFKILEKKFYCKEGPECAGSGYEGYGLKRFP